MTEIGADLNKRLPSGDQPRVLIDATANDVFVLLGVSLRRCFARCRSGTSIFMSAGSLRARCAGISNGMSRRRGACHSWWSTARRSRGTILGNALEHGRMAVPSRCRRPERRALDRLTDAAKRAVSSGPESVCQPGM